MSRRKLIGQLIGVADKKTKRLAAPFSGYSPDLFPKRRGILYVGKATDKDFALASFVTTAATAKSIEDRIDERIFQAKAVSNGRAQKPESSFWRFAHELSSAIDQEAKELSNVAWANLRRIGATSGNPNYPIGIGENNLYVDLLRAEIRELQPAIIVFVTSHYAEKILIEVVEDFGPVNRLKSEDDRPKSIDDVWWMPRGSDSPAVIWMRHPQGAKTKVRKYAAKLASRLSAIPSTF